MGIEEQLSTEIDRLVARIDRLEGAIREWTCGRCEGEKKVLVMHGFRDMKACPDCSGTGLHPTASKALEEGE